MPKGSRFDTKPSQGSRTRTAQGGFKSRVTQITSGFTQKAHSGVGQIPFFLKEQNGKSSNGLQAKAGK